MYPFLGLKAWHSCPNAVLFHLQRKAETVSVNTTLRLGMVCETKSCQIPKMVILTHVRKTVFMQHWQWRMPWATSNVTVQLNKVLWFIEIRIAELRLLGLSVTNISPAFPSSSTALFSSKVWIYLVKTKPYLSKSTSQVVWLKLCRRFSRMYALCKHECCLIEGAFRPLICICWFVHCYLNVKRSGLVEGLDSVFFSSNCCISPLLSYLIPLHSICSLHISPPVFKSWFSVQSVLDPWFFSVMFSCVSSANCK